MRFLALYVLFVFAFSCSKVNYREPVPQVILMQLDAQAFRHITTMKAAEAKIVRTDNLVNIEAVQGDRTISLEFNPNAKVFGYYHIASYKDEKGNFYSTKIWLSRPETSQKFDSSDIGYITDDGYFEFNAFSASGKQIFINGFLSNGRN